MTETKHCDQSAATWDLAERRVALAHAVAEAIAARVALSRAKAEAQSLPVRLLQLDAAGTTNLGGLYDLIVSSMTLHHITDVPALFRPFARHLRPGGRVALADRDEEDGSFHDETMSVPHRGFPRERIRAWMADAGFREIHLETATVTRKEGRDYPIFLATAQKP